MSCCGWDVPNDVFLLGETMIAMACWAIITLFFRRSIRDAFPATHTLVLLLIWASLIAQTTRSMFRLHLLPIDHVEIIGGIVRGLFVLVGVIIMLALVRQWWRQRG